MTISGLVAVLVDLGFTSPRATVGVSIGKTWE